MCSTIHLPGIKIGGHNINNLRYADDIVLIAENDKDLNAMLELIVLESNKKGLSLTIMKAKKACQRMKNILTNKSLSLNIRKSITMLYRTHSSIWMRSLDNKQAYTKIIGSNRNVVSENFCVLGRLKVQIQMYWRKHRRKDVC